MRIKEWLSKHRYTQTQLSEMLGINRSYMSLITSGKKLPSVLLALRIKDVTDGDVDLCDLFDSKTIDSINKKFNGNLGKKYSHKIN